MTQKQSLPSTKTPIEHMRHGFEKILRTLPSSNFHVQQPRRGYIPGNMAMALPLTTVTQAGPAFGRYKGRRDTCHPRAASA